MKPAGEIPTTVIHYIPSGATLRTMGDVINSTSSAHVPAMYITPFIWQANSSGDILVYTGRPVTCLNTRVCAATGTYTPGDSSAIYFTNAPVQYTLPSVGARVAGVPMTSMWMVPGSVWSGTNSYTVFAEAVDNYHGTQPNLHGAVDDAKGFYARMKSASSDWSGLEENYNDNAMEKHWNKDKQASSHLNQADFAYFAGHGYNDRIVFGTAQDNLDLYRTSLSFGGKTKWVVLDACLALNYTTERNWDSTFNGLHSLMGFDTEGLTASNRGTDFANRITGNGYQPTRSITSGWTEAVKQSLDRSDTMGAYKYVEPCLNEKVPEWGTLCTPTKDTAGNYKIHYEKFTAKKSLRI